MATKISFMKLSKATNNFSANNVITSGKMGIVYKAMLLYGTFMAVKRLRASQHYENQFILELITLASLRQKLGAPHGVLPRNAGKASCIRIYVQWKSP